MADETLVHGPEGTIRFPAGMQADDIHAAMVKLYPPPRTQQTFQDPFRNQNSFDRAIPSMEETFGQAPTRRNVPLLNPPRAPEMRKEMAAGDIAGAMINVLTSSEPGAETALPQIGTETVQGARRLGTRGQRLGGAAQLVGALGEATSPLMGLAPLEALGAASSQAALSKAATLGAGLGTGYVGSLSAEKGVRALGGSQQAQELAGQIGFWLPTMAGAALSGLIEGGDPYARQRVQSSLMQQLITQGGVDERLARHTAEEMILKYEATGDARWLNAENITPPNAKKVLNLMLQRTGESALEAGKASVLGHEDEVKRLLRSEDGTLLKPDGSLFTRADYDAARSLNDQLAKAPKGPFLGGQTPTPEATSAETASIQAATETKGRGEPVRTSTGPTIEETVKNMTVEQKVASNQRIADYIDRTNKAREETLRQIAKPERDTTTLQQVQAEHPDWTLSQQLQEAAKRVQPPKGPGLAASNITLEARTQEMLRKHPNMAEGTARRMAQEAMEKERGSLSLRPLKPQIGPQGPSTVWRMGNAMQNVANALGEHVLGDLDAMSEAERKARVITRGVDSEKKLYALQLEEKFKQAIESHDNDTKGDFRAFMDAGEGKPGSRFLKLEDQSTATQLHNEFGKRWDVLQKIKKERGWGEEDLGPGIDNYLSHIWKRPGRAQDVLGAYLNARRPMEGRAGFLKQRIYDYASEGLDRGLEPLSMNPIRMELAALHQIDKFITAHELKDAYKDAGIVKWHTNSADVPLGWDKLHDKLFEPKRFEEGKLIQYGSYYAPPEVARIFNRYLEPGLAGNLVYDTLRGYGNLVNQVNLGMSGYHGTFISIVSGSADIALGLEKAVNNRDIGGVGNVMRGVFNPATTLVGMPIQALADWLGVGHLTRGFTEGSSAVKFYERGRDIQREALQPKAENVARPLTPTELSLQHYVKELVDAGGIFKQEQFYRTPEGQKFWRGVVQTPYKLLTEGPREALKTGYRTVQAGVQRFPVTKWIMDYYVPRVKVGMASYMMEAKLQELVKHGIYDQDVIRTEMAKIWDSVENRAGQLKYDNLFWKKSYKDLAFLAVRAVGWDIGTLREFGGAGVDVLSGLSKLAKGEKPSTNLTSRVGFVIGTTITLGTIGGLMTYLATGKPPQTLLDYMHPQLGRMGTNGKPERGTLPTYGKDIEGFWNHAGRTLVNKLHPDIEQFYEFYNNRDFLDTQIYDRNGPDPLYKKGYDILKWWGKTTTPFAVTTALARIRGGESQTPGGSTTAVAFESFMGIQRAGREIGSSRAEDYIFDNAKRYWEAGPITRESRDRRELFFKFRTQQKLHTLDNKAVLQAWRSGQIHTNDFDRIYNDKGLTNSQSEFKFLASHDLPTAVKALQLMTPEERIQYRLQAADMLGSSQMNELPPEEQVHYIKTIRDLMRQPVK